MASDARSRPTAEKLAKRLSSKQSKYSEDLYEDWWFSLEEGLLHSVNDAAKKYHDFGELFRAHAESTGGPVVAVRTVGDWLWTNLEGRLTRFLGRSEFLAIHAEPVERRSQFAEEKGRRLTSLLKQHLGVRPHRKRENAERDWLLTKWVIEHDLKPHEALERWKKEHPEDQGLSLAGARLAIARTWEAFQKDLWARRLYIYRNNFPQIPELTCKGCNGSGTVANPSWQAWWDWRDRCLQRSRQGLPPYEPGALESDPEPATDGEAEAPCQACDRTGSVSPSTTS